MSGNRSIRVYKLKDVWYAYYLGTGRRPLCTGSTLIEACRRLVEQ